MNVFELKVVTPEGVTYDSEVAEAIVPTASGEITVLAKHTPLVSTLSDGGVMIVRKADNSEHVLAVAGGLIEVRTTGRVVVLADRAERAEDLDQERAEKARQRAEELMQRQDFEDDMEYVRVKAGLQKEIARIRAIEQHTRRRR